MWELCWALKVPGEELCLLGADCVLFCGKTAVLKAGGMCCAVVAGVPGALLAFLVSSWHGNWDHLPLF